MNSTEYFSFNCVDCDFHTNTKSNYTAHMKSKKHYNIVNGITKHFCKACNFQASQKCIYDKHILSQACRDKHKVIDKIKPSIIIKRSQNELQTNFNEMDKVNEISEDWESRNAITLVTMNSGNFTRYSWPAEYLKMEEDYAFLNNEIVKIQKKLRWWERKINKLFVFSTSGLLKEWREKSLNI